MSDILDVDAIEHVIQYVSTNTANYNIFANFFALEI